MSETPPRELAEATELNGDAERRAYVEAWERTHPGQPFPRPWETPEDARRWRTVARGRNWPARPEADVELEVVLSPDDYVWLARRATAAGLRPSQYLARLVAEARIQDEHAPTAPIRSGAPSDTRLTGPLAQSRA